MNPTRQFFQDEKVHNSGEVQDYKEETEEATDVELLNLKIKKEERAEEETDEDQSYKDEG
jgi:hypothetical protein